MSRNARYFQFDNQDEAVTSFPQLGVDLNAKNLEDWIDKAFFAASFTNNMISSLGFNTSTGDLTITMNDTPNTTVIGNLNGRYQIQGDVLDDLNTLGANTGSNEFLVGTSAGTLAWQSGATARTSLGLGSIATQNSNSVSITGGTIAGITDLAIADGGTGASSASAARTNLGLGSLATLSSVNNSNWSGTALAATNGGTGQSTYTTGDILYASGASAISKLAIGTNGQILTISGGLPSWGSLSSGSANEIPYTNGAGTAYTHGANFTFDGTSFIVANLQLAGNTLSSSTGNIVIDPNGASNVEIGNFVFDADQTVGASQDGYVLKYVHGSSHIQLSPNTSVSLTFGTSGEIPYSDGASDFNYSSSFTFNGSKLILGELDVDNITINTNTISTGSGNLILSPFTGQTIVSDGAAATPSIAFSSSTTTGFYRSAADTIGVAIAGSLIYSFNTTAFNITSSLQIDGNTIFNASRQPDTGFEPPATSATVVSGDLVMIWDIDDSNNPKQVTAQSIADLAASGGDSWGDAVDANILPDLTNNRDIGSSSLLFKDIYSIEFRTGSATPRFWLNETDQAVDSKKWIIQSNGGSFQIATSNDAENSTSSRFSMDRNGNIDITGDLTIEDGENIIIGTTSGTKIGTATTQKIGFLGATPIVQQNPTSVTPATFTANTSGISDDSATWATYTIGDIVAILQAYGLLQ